LELFPQSSQAWFASGWIAQHFGRWSDAEEALRQAVKLEPGESMWHNNLGWVLLCTDRPNEALKCFDRALKLNRANRFAIYNRIRALQQLGRRSEANTAIEHHLESDLSAARQRLDAHPDDGVTRIEVVEYLRGLLRLDDAADQAEIAVTRAPEDAAALRALVQVECDRDRFDRARGLVERLNGLDGASLDTLQLRAFIGWHVGDASLADDAARVALDANPEDLRAICAAGFSAAARGSWAEATSHFERALQRAPLDCCLLSASGHAALGGGDEALARKRCDEAERASGGRCLEGRRLRARIGE
jgi:Flp pilus assembly protein TadD